MLFTFPEDAHWNTERQAVEFGVETSTGASSGSRGACSNASYRTGPPPRGASTRTISRTRFESIAERKLRRRQLTEDGNVEISGRDLR
jgi:hypothetical protein